MSMFSLPVLSILLLCISTWLTIKAVKRRNTFHSVFLVLNVVFLFSLIVITVYSLVASDWTIVPFWVYWILIAAGIVTGIFSFAKRYIPGQIMSAGLLLFTGFIAIFSIGILLLALFVIQFIFSIVNWKRYGLEIAQ